MISKAERAAHSAYANATVDPNREGIASGFKAFEQARKALAENPAVAAMLKAHREELWPEFRGRNRVPDNYSWASHVRSRLPQDVDLTGDVGPYDRAFPPRPSASRYEWEASGQKWEFAYVMPADGNPYIRVSGYKGFSYEQAHLNKTRTIAEQVKYALDALEAVGAIEPVGP